MTTVEANGVAHFGDAAAPLVLCAGGTTMLSWPDALCESVARGGRHVVQMASQLGMVFGRLDCKPRWRERLSELALPTLVVHGRRDPFFPVGNGEALAREIPGARLLVLERASTAIPDAAAGEVATAMLDL